MPTRREFLKLTASATAVAAASGVPPAAVAQTTRLSVGMWEHWVPSANPVIKGIIEEWGKANRVEVQVDLISTVGQKLQTTGAAEYRAGTGHDILTFVTWDGTAYKDKLESLNDVAEAIIKKYGPFVEYATYLSRQDGRWITLPSPIGSHSFPLQTRMDLWKQHAGIDVVDMFPADVKKRDKKKVDAWDWKMFLEGCKKVHAAGVPYGGPISQTPDANDWLGPLFLSYGAVMVDEKGDIKVESDATLEVLEYLKELVKYMPPDVYGWDDGSNNRWIISGKGSTIFNPPSSWAVAKRDRPDVAAKLWHHDCPRGPRGRYRAALSFTWGLWKFSKNKQAAKDLLLHLWQKEQQDRFIAASEGYDVPQNPTFTNHPVWTEIGPPKGGQYNYPIRGDEQMIVVGWPARPEIAVSIFNRFLIPDLVSRVTQKGESPKEAMKWAAGQLATYKRG